MARKRWTEEEVERVARLIDKGFSHREVGIFLCVSRSAISGLVRRYQIKKEERGTEKLCLVCGSSRFLKEGFKICEKCKASGIFGSVLNQY